MKRRRRFAGSGGSRSRSSNLSPTSRQRVGHRIETGGRAGLTLWSPLLPVGADCRPAIYERHKWDRAPTPLPFGHVAIALGQLRDYPSLAELALIDEARRRLQDELNEVAATAQRAIGIKAND